MDTWIDGYMDTWIYAYRYGYIYMVTRSAPPPSPLHGLWSRMPPVWGSCVVVWVFGLLGFGFSLSF